MKFPSPRPTFLAVLFLLSSGCGRTAPPPAPPAVVTVGLASERPAGDVRYTGGIEPATSVTLSFKVGGYLASVHEVSGPVGAPHRVQTGDRVVAGCALAQLEQRDFLLKVEQADAGLAECQAGIEAAEAELLGARAVLTLADTDYGRSKNLLDNKTITPAGFDGARAKRDGARATVSGVEAKIRSLKAKASGLAALKGEAMEALAHAELKAPFDGVVLKRFVEPGALVGTGTPGFVIADDATAKFVFGVPDRSVSRFKVGDSLEVRAEAFPERRFEGLVSRIAACADPVTRTFDIEISIDNASRALRPGMVASVTIGDAPAGSSCLVPIGSIVRVPGLPGQFGVMIPSGEGGRTLARLRRVAIGDPVGSMVEIVSGLKAGERILVIGAPLVADGEPVTAIDDVTDGR